MSRHSRRSSPPADDNRQRATTRAREAKGMELDMLSQVKAILEEELAPTRAAQVAARIVALSEPAKATAPAAPLDPMAAFLAAMTAYAQGGAPAAVPAAGTARGRSGRRPSKARKAAAGASTRLRATKSKATTTKSRQRKAGGKPTSQALYWAVFRRTFKQDAHDGDEAIIAKADPAKVKEYEESARASPRKPADAPAAPKRGRKAAAKADAAPASAPPPATPAPAADVPVVAPVAPAAPANGTAHPEFTAAQRAALEASA